MVGQLAKMAQIVAFQSRQEREKKERQRYFKEAYSKSCEQKRQQYLFELQNLLEKFYLQRVQANYDALIMHLQNGLDQNQSVLINVRQTADSLDIEPVYGTDGRWYFAVYTSVSIAEESVNKKMFDQVYRVNLGLMLQEVLSNENMGGICFHPHSPQQCMVPKEYIRIFYNEWKAGVLDQKAVLQWS